MIFDSHCVGGSVFILPCCGLIITASMSAAVSADNDVGFARDIQPLLAKKCFACHGPAEHEAGVANRLSRNLSMVDGRSSPEIQPAASCFAV
jgi:hypothetical protein